MSLINDALKRASQSPSVPTPKQAETDPQPLRPVEYKNSTPFWAVYLFPALLVVLLGGGGWLLLRNSAASTSDSERVAARARTPAEPQPSTPPATETVSSAASEPRITKPISEPPLPLAVAAKATTRPADLPKVEPPDLAPESRPIATIPSASVPPTAPLYKLQGIFFRPARPMAMINGRNVLPGDKVGEARVISIQRDSVTLAVDGQTKVLTLSQIQ